MEIINTEQLTTFIKDVIRGYDYSSHIEECIDGSYALDNAVEMKLDELGSNIQEDMDDIQSDLNDVNQTIEDIKSDLNDVSNQTVKNTDSLNLINNGIKGYLSAIGQEEIKQLKTELSIAKKELIALQLVEADKHTI